MIIISVRITRYKSHTVLTNYILIFYLNPIMAQMTLDDSNFENKLNIVNEKILK